MGGRIFSFPSFKGAKFTPLLPRSTVPLVSSPPLCVPYVMCQRNISLIFLLCVKISVWLSCESMESVGLEISTGFSPMLCLQAWEVHEERTHVAKSKFQVLKEKPGQSPVAVCRRNKYSLFTTHIPVKGKTAFRNVWHWYSSRCGRAELGICSRCLPHCIGFF